MALRWASRPFRAPTERVIHEPHRSIRSEARFPCHAALPACTGRRRRHRQHLRRQTRDAAAGRRATGAVAGTDSAGAQGRRPFDFSANARARVRSPQSRHAAARDARDAARERHGRRGLHAGRTDRVQRTGRRPICRRAEGSRRNLRAVRFQSSARGPSAHVRSENHRNPVIMSTTDTLSGQTVAADAEILLAQPRGFCAGVDRAIEIVERAIAMHGAPIYVRHEIVHNKYVVEDLKKKGAIFVEELEEVPAGNTVIFSAHGVSKAVRDEAGVRGLRIYDATCPLVTKVHVEVAKMRQDGVDIVMIGHKGHPEVEGTMGQVERGMHLVESVEDVQKLELADPERIALVTQTTLSVDDAAEIIAALKAKYPKIREPKKQDICYATQNRQDAVKFMAPQCDVVIVVGSPNSSNSSRLREVAEKRGVAAYMVDAPEQIDPAWVAGKRRIGVTAGASAPEVLAQAVIARLRELGVRNVRALEGIEENVSFPLPRGLNLPAA
ncbi:hydroxymethylbutenyl pyrophosphate reductase [Burkholderia multivorans ATCC 17616]|nr:hydroxymethylbutenyl pyrophosphate reductase [Burkholderia multivorans ATCC 17616]